MKRRTFIAGLGSAAAWPMVARAQQGERVQRIGMLMPGDENDPEQKHRLTAFTQALADLGRPDGRNARMDVRWGGGDTNRMRALAQELVGLQPDIMVTNGVPATAALQRETRTIPIVFANVPDPVASGIVARLDRSSGNVTGFGLFEPSLGGKWLELLSEIAPGIKRAAIMFNPDTAASTYMPSLQTAARSLKVTPITAPVHSDVESWLPQWVNRYLSGAAGMSGSASSGLRPNCGIDAMGHLQTHAVQRTSAPARTTVPLQPSL